MSFATVKANLEKEGASLLCKLRDELSEYQDVFRSNLSESYNKIIIRMKEDLVIAESVALHEQLERARKSVGDTTFWYDSYKNYIEMKNIYSGYKYGFTDIKYIKDFQDELKDIKTSLVETASSGCVKPDLGSIVGIFDLAFIDLEFDQDLHFHVKRFLDRYRMYRKLKSV